MAKTGADLVLEVRADLDEATEQNWTDANILMWLNKGLTEVMALTRGQREHWHDRIILTTDPASTIFGTSYNPAVSLAPTAGQSTLTLPPDCIEVVKILPTTQSDLDAGVQFSQRPQNSVEFITAQRWAQSVNQRTYYYDTYGLTTLIVAPVFGSTFNISLQYVAVPEEITLNDTVTRIPDWMLDGAVMYAHFRAMNAIKHDDYGSAYKLFEAKVQRLLSLTRPRNTQDVKVVEGVFDADDSGWNWDYDL